MKVIVQSFWPKLKQMFARKRICGLKELLGAKHDNSILSLKNYRYTPPFGLRKKLINSGELYF